MYMALSPCAHFGFGLARVGCLGPSGLLHDMNSRLDRVPKTYQYVPGRLRQAQE